MSATTPGATDIYWVDAEPKAKLVKGNLDPGSEQYWVDGATAQILLPSGSFQNSMFLLFF